MVVKRVSYFDANDVLRSRSENIMELHANDVVGEDRLWYGRECQYTAKVSSQNATFFQIENQ